MAFVETNNEITRTGERYNVSAALEEMAGKAPFRRAVIFPAGRTREGTPRFVQYSFYQLNDICNRYAHGLSGRGIRRGDRVLLLLASVSNLIVLSFALAKIGAVPIIIDPGMGLKAFARCVKDCRPSAFIGIPKAHWLTFLFPEAFSGVRTAITDGRSFFPGRTRLEQLKSGGAGFFPAADTRPDDEAAIVFTSGSTGIPKGVVYTHGLFKAQIAFLRKSLGVEEGEIDLPCLPIFALFNPALGVTTVIPEMDFRKPARVNPARLLEAIQTHGVTNTFGSPAIWKKVAPYCLEKGIRLSSLRRVLMAGAPVEPALIRDFQKLLDRGGVHTPFGATEALPVTNITGQEILDAELPADPWKWGVCVGKPTEGTEVRIIEITDEPVRQWSSARPVPDGQVGEIVVKGAVVTRAYINRPDQNELSKIADREGCWHRMGDLGFFDPAGRLWMCGRKSHRVTDGTHLWLPVACERVFNEHPQVRRTALVGVGKKERPVPAIVVELASGTIPSSAAGKKLIGELKALGGRYEHTGMISHFLFHRSFPVDARHNTKIIREKLAVWANKKLNL